MLPTAQRDAILQEIAKRKRDQLCAFGVETTALPDGAPQPDLVIYYVNRDDSYATTLLYVNGVWSVGSWGDIVEKY